MQVTDELIRSFVQVLQVDPGFDPQHVLTGALNLPEARYTDDQQIQFFNWNTGGMRLGRFQQPLIGRAKSIVSRRHHFHHDGLPVRVFHNRNSK